MFLKSHIRPIRVNPVGPVIKIIVRNITQHSVLGKFGFITRLLQLVEQLGRLVRYSAWKSGKYCTGPRCWRNVKKTHSGKRLCIGDRS